MSELTLNLLEAQRTLHGRFHGSVIDRLVASLGADPETVDECELALGRFCQRDADSRALTPLRTGMCLESWDAGIVCIDLDARVIAYRSTYSGLLLHGQEFWHDGRSATDQALPFHLADDWILSSDVDGFESTSQERREARAGQPRIDERSVLYGRLPEHIVCELFARRGELRGADDSELNDLIRNVHAGWLLAPRDDLNGRAPRDVMLDHRHPHISFDTQYQQHHWSMLRQPPPGVPRESAAYRFGGFGTHEIVVYYDLVRDLLWECAGRWRTRLPDEDDLPAEAEHLQRHRQDLLHAPNPEFHGRTPASIIDRERRRLPEKAGGDEAVVDPDCPCCQMLADEDQFGPVFWDLDGCNMDDDFAFSFHRTRDEWEAEQRKFEEWSREFDERRDNGPDEIDDFPF